MKKARASVLFSVVITCMCFGEEYVRVARPDFLRVFIII